MDSPTPLEMHMGEEVKDGKSYSYGHEDQLALAGSAQWLS